MSTQNDNTSNKKESPREVNNTHFEERLNYILKNSPALIYAFHPTYEQAGMTFCNKNLSEFTGKSLKKYSGKKSGWLNLIHKDDKIRYIKSVEKLTVENPVSIEYRILHKDGTYHSIVDKVSLIETEDKCKEVIGIAIDVTDSNKQEDKLRMLAMVADRTSNAVLIGNNKGEVEWVNDGFTRMSGYTLSEMKGKHPKEVLQGPHTDPETVQRMDEHLMHEQPFTEDVISYTKEGVPFWVELFVEPVRNKHGEVDKFIAIQTDITQRKLFEEKLIQARIKAEEASKAKTQFLSVMSHEIRTPMNAILGMANLLQDELKEYDQLDKLQTLKFSANHLLKLIDDILDFSKIESGKIELEQKVFSLKELVKVVSSITKPEVGAEKVLMDVDIDESIPEYFKGDKQRLSQVLINLLSNAIKFTKHGYVQLFIRHEETVGNICALQFEVLDSGCGIPKERLASIFESFEQASANTAKEYGGTGLGLTIVKKLVELMGGDIKVKSTVGKGSSFYFTISLPIAKNKAKLPSRASADQEQILNGKRVLLVEDNVINQKVAINFLDKWNMHTRIANNGKEALRILEEESFDCILMDLQMPVMDGYETSKVIRNSNNPEIMEIPIIALTASAVSELKEEAFKIGLNEFITKPFNPDKLKKVLVQTFTSQMEKAA